MVASSTFSPAVRPVIAVQPLTIKRAASASPDIFIVIMICSSLGYLV
jgi:hypothetical protein